MSATTYRCRDCGLQFTDRALSDAHLTETTAGGTVRSHTLVTVKPVKPVSPWAEDLAAMFDNMVTLPSGDTVRADTAGEGS